MALMRQLEFEHRKLWDGLVRPSAEMVAAGDCDAALLSGWSDRDISLWDVSGASGKPDIWAILFALCRTRKPNWEKISYLLFPKEVVTAAGLELTASNGKTGDNKVDPSGTHYEIKGITGKGICSLLCHISNGEFEIKVFKRADYDRILLEIYDKNSKSELRLLVESATSEAPLAYASESGTVLPKIPGLEKQQLPLGDTSVSDPLPKPNSSTKLTD